MMDESLLAPCNVYCGNCSVYRRGVCLGCSVLGEKRDRVGWVFCDILPLRQGQGV